MKSIYSEKTLSLFKEAENICKKVYKPNKGCIVCEYRLSMCCKALCLQLEYNIINKKTLELISIYDYIENDKACLLSSYCLCKNNEKADCNMCLIEKLLKDKDIAFVKKE